jgi:hypothetical protein
MSERLTRLDYRPIFQQRFNCYPLIQFAKGCYSNCQTGNNSRLANYDVRLRLLFHWNYA